jgi:hypothetical protein
MYQRGLIRGLAACWRSAVPGVSAIWAADAKIDQFQLGYFPIRSIDWNWNLISKKKDRPMYERKTTNESPSRTPQIGIEKCVGELWGLEIKAERCRQPVGPKYTVRIWG